MDFLVDCGLDTSTLLGFPPRNTIGDDDDGADIDHRTTIDLDIFGPQNPEDDNSSRKRRKLDVFAEAGRFLVQTPDFSSVDWKAVDFILISSYRHMLALPFVTEYTEFMGKIYATEPTIEFGRQLMNELVYYFGESSSTDAASRHAPSHSNIGKLLQDESTFDLNLSRTLYTTADVQSCIDKIQPIRYCEHLSLYDSLRITAYSSGYCLGSANWAIDCGYEKIAIISSSSTIKTIHPAPFDRTVFENASVVLLSDLRTETHLSYEEALAKIEECVVRTINSDGNVLFPCTSNGIILDLVEDLDRILSTKGLSGHVRMFVISPMAEESLKYSNILGEWMCKSNQDKLYTAENPTIHKLLMSKQRLFHVARVDSSLSQIYKQPCIVFAGHVSLRSGAAVEFLKKWGKNAANVIIFTESDIDHKEAFSPFEGLKINQETIPLDIRLSVQEVGYILQQHQPKTVLVPSDVDEIARNTLLSHQQLVVYEYSGVNNVTINSQYERTSLTESLAKLIRPKVVGNSLVGSLNGNLMTHNNRFLLAKGKASVNNQRFLWGDARVDKILDRFAEVGIDEVSVIKEDMLDAIIITLGSPKATITLTPNSSNIDVEDSTMRKFIADIVVNQFTQM
ncbi:10902_t:CDS:10 [Paraglomus brasilianum]|uniref:10902_t:CDS:1 n=1 Tax=Paraglomus brasilianum TaxID=144538 RepID=A0A9N9FAT0_9GLOM|nr:10902_t:CDS:10 [Paraglomus brasilianum]